MWNIYLRDGMKEKEEYASPILAHDFSGLPPTYIEVSEFDSLYDEGCRCIVLFAGILPNRMEANL